MIRTLYALLGWFALYGFAAAQTDSLLRATETPAKDLVTPLVRPAKDSLMQSLAGPGALEASNLRGRERVSIWPPRYKPLRRVLLNFRFDFRHSFINPTDVPVLINGFNLGLILHNRHEISLGYYWLTNSTRNSYANRVVVRSVLRNATNNELADLNLWFISLGYAYYVVKSRWVELRFPIEVGYGNSVTTTQITTTVGNTVTTKLEETKNVFIPGQLGAAFELRLTRWLGGSVSAGYRTVLSRTDARSDFESWYYAYGAKVYLGYIYRDLKRLSDKERRKVERRDDD